MDELDYEDTYWIVTDGYGIEDAASTEHETYADALADYLGRTGRNIGAVLLEIRRVRV